MSVPGNPRRDRGRGATLAASALALLALLALAPLAQADYDPLGSGTTKLTLEKSFTALLEQNGIKISGIEGARVSGQTVTFPVSGGKFDPTTSNGFVEHAGALLFKAGPRSVPLSSLQLKTTQRHAPFSAKLGGGQLKLASAAKLAVSRQGFASKVKVTTLKLSAKVAGRLAKKLRLRGVFKAGQPLGSSITKTNPVTVALQQSGKLSLELNAEFLAKLKALFVAVNPIFPAEHPGPFTLPIFTGTLAPDGSQGIVQAQGSLELLQLGGGQVFWREPVLDFAAKTLSPEVELDPSPPFGGKLGPLEIAAFSGESVAANPGARTIAVSGAALTSSAQTAAVLNEVFAKPQNKSGVFVPGEPLGTVSFIAQAQ